MHTASEMALRLQVYAGILTLQSGDCFCNIELKGHLE